MSSDRTLMNDRWAAADPADLKLLLEKHIGGPGQFTGGNRVHLFLPSGGADCQIVLNLDEHRVVGVEKGAAFNQRRWDLAVSLVDKSLLSQSRKVGREFSFSTYRVSGSWRGRRSGLQILPAPIDAPRASVEIADHPFVLEFGMDESCDWQVTNQRRIRLHRKLTRLLNILLRGHVSLPPRQQKSSWATIGWSGSVPETRWVNLFFSAKLGKRVMSELSPVDEPKIKSIDPEEYYSTAGHDGGPLCVPGDLDEMIALYLDLPQANAAKFDRAAFWIDMASGLWHQSVSSSFGALVSAVEALTVRGARHSFECPECGEQMSHETPGAARRFRDFFELYAPQASMKKQRDEIYSLRSDIFHGSKLMYRDEVVAFDLHPAEFNQDELHDNLWRLVRIALRNWLLKPAPACA